MITKCDKCEKKFEVQLQETNIELQNTKVILVFFACPECKKIYRVSIQDARYYDLKEDLEKTKKKIRKNHGSNNIEFARVLDNMVKKKLKRLRDHVDKVNKMFPGTFTFVASENNPKEQIIKYLP